MANLAGDIVICQSLARNLVGNVIYSGRKESNDHYYFIFFIPRRIKIDSKELGKWIIPLWENYIPNREIKVILSLTKT